MSTSRVLGLMIASAWLVADVTGQEDRRGRHLHLNSDCGGSFVCTWASATSPATHRRLPEGTSCIIASVQSTVCQGPTPCTYNSDCQTGSYALWIGNAVNSARRMSIAPMGRPAQPRIPAPSRARSIQQEPSCADGGLGGTSGTSGAGGTGGSTSPALMLPDLLADMSGSTGGTGGSAGGTSGVGGSSGTAAQWCAGHGRFSRPNPDASQILPRRAGQHRRREQHWGILSTAGSPASGTRLAPEATRQPAAQQALPVHGGRGTTNLPDAAADVNAGTTDAPTAPASPPPTAVCRTLRRLPVMPPKRTVLWPRAAAKS